MRYRSTILGFFLAAESSFALEAPSIASRVDGVFAAYDDTDSPGCSVAVFRDGRIEYARGYGMANLEHALANSTQTVFDIGSTSKQFTAMAILLLEQDGKLNIEDDVRKYVPELPSYGPAITIRNLMQHTSGLRDYLELFWLRGIETEDLTTSEDALEVIVRQKALNFAPGSEYLYSNSGFFLLSEIVKRVSGKTLAEFAAERIFDPLGMGHTRFHDDHRRIVPRRATGYAPGSEGSFVIDMSDYEQTGDGAVYTTVEDLFLWDRNFYTAKVGSSTILERMQTRGSLPSGKPMSYGLGLTMGNYRGLETVSHGGSWAGYRAQLLRFPEERFSVACLCNLAGSDPSTLAQKVAGIYLAGEMEPEPSPPIESGEPLRLSAEELRAREGAYQEDGEGTYAFVSVRDGALFLEGEGSGLRLDPVSPARFVAGRLEVQFEAGRMLLRTGDGTKREFARFEPWAPSADVLSSLAGVYRSDEVGGSIEIVLSNGALAARHRTIPGDSFRPTRADSFHAGRLDLKFRRDSGGQPTGFVLNIGRVKGLEYVRVP